MGYEDTHGPAPLARPPGDPPGRRTGLAAMIVYFVVIIGGTASIGLYATLGRTEEGTVAGRTTPSLSPDHALHRFGDVPADGPGVETEFTLTNTGSAPVTLADVNTSCACVTATLRLPDGTTEGPFGMRGHGRAPSLGGKVGPGASFTVTVRLDPGSTDPDKARSVEYHVRIHTANGGAMATLTLAANLDGGMGRGKNVR